MENIAIIPAQNAYKGISGFLLKIVNGMPLLFYTIDAAKNSNLFSKIITISDSDDIRRFSSEFGCDIPLINENNRFTNVIDMINAVITYYEAKSQTIDNIILLQPTSPLRSSNDIKDAFSFFIERKAESLVSVSKANINPLTFFKIAKDYKLGFDLNPYFNDLSTNDYYRINGSIYIIKTDLIRTKKQLIFSESATFVMQTERSFEVKSYFDLSIINYINSPYYY